MTAKRALSELGADEPVNICAAYAEKITNNLHAVDSWSQNTEDFAAQRNLNPQQWTCYREYIDHELALATDGDPELSYVDATVPANPEQVSLEHYVVARVLPAMLSYQDANHSLCGPTKAVLGLLDVWGARHRKRTERYHWRL